LFGDRVIFQEKMMESLNASCTFGDRVSSNKNDKNCTFVHNAKFLMVFLGDNPITKLNQKKNYEICLLYYNMYIV
jgi:hypothetical protein